GLVLEGDVDADRPEREAGTRADEPGTDDVHRWEAGGGPLRLRSGRHSPAALYSLPISSRFSGRHRPDFVEPSVIGPTCVRTRDSTGWPTCSSMRRTMCLRPSWRITSTIA